MAHGIPCSIGSQSDITWAFKYPQTPPSPPTSARAAQSLIIISKLFWQTVVMKWIIDLEAYQLDGFWFPKEIALLNVETMECFCSTVKAEIGYNLINPTHRRTIAYQYRRHRLRWEEGDETLANVKRKIQSMVKSQDTVYCKGDQKVYYFQEWFDNVVEINAPSFKTLNKYPLRYCDKKHGLICAKRKCFELIEYV